MTHSDMAIFWALSLLSGLAMVAARLGYLLFGIAPLPPSDPEELTHWKRKRRWLLFAELLALPAFATAAVALTVYFNLPAVTSVLISMVFGALGFGFLLNALQFMARRKLEMEEPQ